MEQMRRSAPKVDELNSIGLSVAARTLGVSRQTLYTWAEKGLVRLHPLPGKLGRTGEPALRILRGDLDRLTRRRDVDEKAKDSRLPRRR